MNPLICLGADIFPSPSGTRSCLVPDPAWCQILPPISRKTGSLICAVHLVKATTLPRAQYFKG